MRRTHGFLRTFLLCVVVMTELAPAFSEAPVSIAVVLSRDIAPYREALRGFERGLKTSRRPHRLIEFNLESSAQNLEGMIDKIRSRRPELIVTFGSAATEFVTRQVADIPVVFSLVLPATGDASLQSLRARHRNVAGASMQIPLERQFRTIREVLPEARRVGVLYDPGISGPLVEEARKEAARASLELVALPVASEEEVIVRLEEAEGRVDLLWSVADSTVFSPQSLQHILLSTIRSRIPFVGLSPSFVRAGALLALSCDHEDVGLQSSEIAIRILAGEPPQRIETAVPRQVSLTLNMNTAKQIQVAISDEVVRRAAAVF